MPTIHARLQQARENAGYETAADAARAFGWNENTYRSRENGQRGVPRAWLITYAKTFKVSLAWLMTGAPDERSGPAGEEMRSVPILDWGKLAMDVGRLNLEVAATKGRISVPRELDGELAALPVLDDSMVDTNTPRLSLYKGDIVVIDVSMRRPKPGQIVLIEDTDNRGHVLRRATFPSSKIIRFVAADQNHPPIELPVGSHKILGVVRLIQRQIA